VATEKQRGLRARYGAGDFACQYFDLHITADVYHARVWREQLTKLLAEDPGLIPQAMDSASTAAQALWQALDGIERERQARKLAA
jgi:pyrroloquinoline-quinone synthase